MAGRFIRLDGEPVSIGGGSSPPELPVWGPTQLSQEYDLEPAEYVVTASRTGDVVTISVSGTANLSGWLDLGYELLPQYAPALSQGWMPGLFQFQALTQEKSLEWWGLDFPTIFVTGREMWEEGVFPFEFSYAAAPTDVEPN